MKVNVGEKTFLSFIFVNNKAIFSSSKGTLVRQQGEPFVSYGDELVLTDAKQSKILADKVSLLLKDTKVNNPRGGHSPLAYQEPSKEGDFFGRKIKSLYLDSKRFRNPETEHLKKKQHCK